MLPLEPPVVPVPVKPLRPAELPVAVPVVAKDIEEKGGKVGNYCNYILIVLSILLVGLAAYLIYDTVQLHMEINSSTVAPCKTIYV